MADKENLCYVYTQLAHVQSGAYREWVKKQYANASTP